jgi:hypothetical protein
VSTYLKNLWSALVCIAKLYVWAMYTMPGGTAEIPLQTDAGLASQYEEMILFVTQDGGKTWKAVDHVKPSEKFFHFTSSDNATYGFAVQVKLADGSFNPPNTDQLKVAYRIRFGAGTTESAASGRDRGAGELDAMRSRVAALEQRVERAERRRLHPDQETKELKDRIEKLERRLADLEKGDANGSH